MLNEDVQLSGVLRPQLEALGLRFAPLDVALGFAIENASPLHSGIDALGIFGHHSRNRQLASLHPLAVHSHCSRADIEGMYGEPDLMRMMEARGYHVRYAEPGNA